MVYEDFDNDDKPESLYKTIIDEELSFIKK
jgi:hypothetical protein